MGSKRIGLARMEALLENLKRELAMGGATVVGTKAKVHTVTDSTVALTESDSGSVYVMSAAGITFTLPDSGSGDINGVTYEFVMKTQGATQKIVCSDTTNEKIQGALIASDTDADTSSTWSAELGDSFSSINFASVAQGEPGSRVKLTCIGADRWQVEGVVLQSGGSEATPFATS